MSELKVTVCLITYNHEKYIKKAIDSILKQEVDFEYEILIGDDMSKDSTRKILLEYEKKYPNKFRLIFNKFNIGIVNNFLNAIRSAKGEYIAMLEGDDFWESTNKLKKQVEFFENNPKHSVSFHKAKIINSFGGVTRYSPELKYMETDIPFLKLLQSNFINTCTVMYRRSCFNDDTKLFKDSYFVDWLLNVSFAIGGKVGYVDGLESVYRVHEGGAWSKKKELFKYVENVNTLKNFKKYFNNKDIEIFREGFIETFIYSIEVCLNELNVIDLVRIKKKAMSDMYFFNNQDIDVKVFLKSVRKNILASPLISIKRKFILRIVWFP